MSDGLALCIVGAQPASDGAYRLDPVQCGANALGSGRKQDLVCGEIPAQGRKRRPARRDALGVNLQTNRKIDPRLPVRRSMKMPLRGT